MIETVEFTSRMAILVILDDFSSKVKTVAFGWPHSGQKVQRNQVGILAGAEKIIILRTKCGPRNRLDSGGDPDQIPRVPPESSSPPK